MVSLSDEFLERVSAQAPVAVKLSELVDIEGLNIQNVETDSEKLLLGRDTRLGLYVLQDMLAVEDIREVSTRQNLE